jgi:hypothetical protein
MKLTRILVGKCETVNLGNCESAKYIINLEADIESKDELADVEAQLHDLCNDYISVSKEKDRVQSQTSVRKNNGNATPGNGTPVKGEAEKEQKNSLIPPVKKENNQQDATIRPPEQLIKELGIQSLSHAGYLRVNKKINYKEWQGVHALISRLEIENSK